MLPWPRIARCWLGAGLTAMVSGTDVLPDLLRRGDSFEPVIAPGKLLRLKLIGQMEAWTVSSESVLPLGRKTRALLAILALTAPRPMARVRLAELLWSRRPEEPARASLRQEVHRLVEALHPVHANILLPSRDRLGLDAELVWTDVNCVLNASVSDPAGLALLTGEVLDGFDGLDPMFDAWLVAERERIRDKARGVAEAMLRGVTEPTQVIRAARQLLALDKAHEGAWRALMVAQTALGERGLAIQAFEQCQAALADLLSASPSPETIRLIAEIRGGAPAAATQGADVELPATIRSPRPLRAKLGVLPLRAGVGAEHAHLSHSLPEDITAALARFRWIKLVPASSMAQFSSRDGAELHHTFGLDLLLDGRVQQVGDVVRVSVQLLDLRDDGELVWFHRYDQPVRDVAAHANSIATDIAAQLDGAVLLIEGRRASALPVATASAYELVHRALPLITRFERGSFQQAGDLLSRAVLLEPEFAAAHAWRAYWLAFAIGQGWQGDTESALLAAGQHAERALTLDPQDARALTIIGHVRAYVHQQPSKALKFHERALVLNPNLAMAWGFAALTYTYLGDLDEASRRFDQYQRLCPVDSNAFFFASGMSLLALSRRDYGEAIRFGRRASELNPGFCAGLKHYLAALGHAGWEGQAGEVRQRLLAIAPDFSIAQFLARCPFEQQADREHYAEGLRRAGVP